MRYLLFMVMLAAGSLLGCSSKTTPSSADAAPPTTTTLGSLPLGGAAWFEDVTKASGIDFTHRNGEEANQYTILESLGGGVGVIDFDQDGLPDLILPGGGLIEGQTIKGLPVKLYRNLGNFQFEDVTEKVGLTANFYCHGAAVADFDRDGWPDFALTGWGRVQLWHNQPDGSGGRKFVEIGEPAGLGGHLWATSAAWADLDGDGFPELYVSQYVDWSFDKNHPTDCTYSNAIRDVCQPGRFNALPDKLFKNQRHGTFVEVSQTLKLRTDGKGLGVIAVDVNNDQKPDLYATNDTVENHLYLNQSSKGLLQVRENALAAGVARDDRGTPNGSMGIDAADFNQSGKASLFCTNYEGELHALYQNDSTPTREFFRFATRIKGLATIGQTWVGWGTCFADFDHHGWEDLFIANGHVIRHPQGKTPRNQPPVLFRNENGTFKNITPQGGSYFTTSHCARGHALVDLNNDGRLDLVISHVNQPVTILKNVIQTPNHWVTLELQGKDRRDVVGTRVVVHAGGVARTRFAKGGGSYASSPDRRLNYGLGSNSNIEKIEVFWSWTEQPEVFAPVPVDGFYRLTEGTGKPEKLQPPTEAAKPSK